MQRGSQLVDDNELERLVDLHSETDLRRRMCSSKWVALFLVRQTQFLHREFMVISPVMRVIMEGGLKKRTKSIFVFSPN